MAPAGLASSFLASDVWFHNPSLFKIPALAVEEVLPRPIVLEVVLGSRDSTDILRCF